MRVAALLIATTIAATSPALADDCADTFPTRLADAKRAVAERNTYIEQHKSDFAAAAWFGEHCRFLTDLEIAVRKLDDPMAFVCDGKAKGKPKGLTAELVANYSAHPLVNSFQSDEAHSANAACWESDTASRMSLVALERLTPIESLEFFCLGDEREKCVKARETIAAVRAKGHK